MPRKKGKKWTKGINVFLLTVGVIAFLIGLSRISQSSQSEQITAYSATKPCYAYDVDGGLAAWVNVTLTTNASILQPNVPIDVTLRVKGIYVPSGNWTYAVLEGATAAFPSREPSDWSHSVNKVIVLKQSDFFTYYGSRIVNYTFGGGWNILIHVVADTVFIVDNIPPNPTDLPMAIYTVPDAVDIASAESIAQMKSSMESEKATIFWSGISFIFLGLISSTTACYRMLSKS